jgi:hypothetical protein
MSDDLENEDIESEDELADAEEFLITRVADRLIDGAAELAKKLLELPMCSEDQRAALEKAISALGRLPKPTADLVVEYGFSYRGSYDDAHYWSVYFDETELKWSAGGYIHGPAGGDSYTSFQLSLFRGGEDWPIGSAEAWLDWKCNFDCAVDISANDYNPETNTSATDEPEANPRPKGDQM